MADATYIFRDGAGTMIVRPNTPYSGKTLRKGLTVTSANTPAVT